MLREVTIEKLNASAFKPYGDVIDVPTGAEKGGHPANHGTAARYNYFTTLVNDRKSPEAKLNVCMFRSTPQEIPFSIKLLERHKYSTQMFIPMTDKPSGYLVACCRNDPVTDTPDFSTLRVFIGNSKQAFNYHPGTWHHPMIAVENIIDFVCFVYERNEEQIVATEDTEEIFFPKSPILAKMERHYSKL